MTVSFKKWPDRKDYFKRLRDITSEHYPELTNREVSEEVTNLLKNAWISRRVEAKLADLKVNMDKDESLKH